MDASGAAPGPARSRHLPPEHPLLQRPLPRFAGGAAEPNLVKCRWGRNCSDNNCKFWHSDKETICPKSCRLLPGHCQLGLHIEASAVRETFSVDLECPQEAITKLQTLESEAAAYGAAFVRMVVFGIAYVRRGLLKKLLDRLPLVHELLLPDRKREPSLLVAVCDIVEGSWRMNPRLRTVVFADGVEEQLW